MTLVLFGATGDLAQRKLFPALYNLYLDGKLPSAISIIGLGRTNYSDRVFQMNVHASLQEFSRRDVQPENVEEFISKFRYCVLDVFNEESYQGLLNLIQMREQELGIAENRMFYLSVAPDLVEIITSNLQSSKISDTKGWKRLIVEKPFGTDLKTARELNEKLSKVFNEEEIYRIDHYLGKPMVQNLETLKFANPILELLWNHDQIANVQITASETVGIEKRAGYYDQAGAIRDMAQNHLLQLLMMTALDIPENLTAQEVEQEKREVVEALRPISKEEASKHIIRGQYAAGEVLGESVIGYQDEPGVVPASKNDTYFAARLYIENPSWENIPFYIRTGKRLEQKSTRIVIEFKNKWKGNPAFEDEGITPNLLIFEINPNESVSLLVNLKNPSTERYEPTNITFSVNSNIQPESYELLLSDAIEGDKTFFAHWKEVELSWQWIQPILEAFQEDALPLYPYPAGSKGPEAADRLLQEDGFNWW
ncbi:glucose-6-phosphate dehydrogenase [Planococcus sp. N028]|uniref:Glucose-6-phosphate 1-dehydrogenase n=1 Tax=Planococcus shixiaomingii TaxID=3058393 RepID=A0ABT8N276_9BACL|nr:MULTISPECIES: glucose-6-phosphate dehydrogenase [unclassified Planococcus (in: firmicutes)]MDN7241983.1 glucose-6-phosphate dehydrogenase [Planococcus sp. N028]WKA56782.1 glucose-6-phosphate dehydrogenase [Planococcus sp. N022]